MLPSPGERLRGSSWKIWVQIPDVPPMTYDPEKAGAFCSICPLKGKPVVPPTFHPAPAYVVVGDSPSRADEKMGAAFSGQAGGLLDSLLRTNGLRRDKAHLTNAALCRGESDRDNDKA